MPSKYLTETVEGPTPNGGSYFVRFYNARTRQQATEVIVVEYDENDEQVAETSGTLDSEDG